MSNENQTTETIQTPTPGRVVLYAPETDLDAARERSVLGDEWPGYPILPAVVLRHDGEGQVRLWVCGYPDVVFTARHGRVETDGRVQPPVGRWCYPPIVRETLEVPAYEAE